MREKIQSLLPEHQILKFDVKHFADQVFQEYFINYLE